VNAPAARRQDLVRYDGMQHLVIKHILKKPERHEWSIKCPVDPDNPVFLLDCAKHEMIPGAMFSSPAPHDSVTAKASTKIPLI